jgi:hypothetical protein
MFHPASFHFVCSRASALWVRMGDLTNLLKAIEAGDAGAVDELFPLVYTELRRLAAAQMA